eukprot:CAMPEP_0114504884 /NCGR_PEP_ID=MMETSP0109-20121206/10533_1 /TAXON_ID=29199 /ORGANISM="Chlorarachnion reptans, Strain CCCM449" /LENGTH=613 /DNA_ID=CAMNT_0001683237 /DNA_START=58 /DNA_END=1899 /DNA_ORIENTATION=+
MAYTRRHSAVCVLLLLAPSLLRESRVDATSMKMDFLTLTQVRSDPIVAPGELAAHMHTFFGANVAGVSTTYEDLRAESENTGNVLENHSLYWYPSIYRQDPATGRFIISPIFLNSAYYIWENGFNPTAFPNGFKMLGGGYGLTQWQEATCVGRGGCPNGNCTTTNDYFPPQTCQELELSMQMPSCWDGVNIDSLDHRSHVAYVNSEDECPPSHPVQIPRVFIFTRIRPYPGGVHMFADGSGYFHSDYFSGWDATFLQGVMDSCENPSFGPNPDAFCDEYVTFRDTPNPPKEQSDDVTIVNKLTPLQPTNPFDPATVSSEPITDVAVLPGPNRIVTGSFVPTTAAPVATGPQPTLMPSTAPTLAPTPQPGSNVLTFGTVFNALPCEQGEATRSELRQHLLLQANVTDAKVDAPICSSVRLNSEMTFSNDVAAMDFNDVLTSANGIDSVFGSGTGWNGSVPDSITEVLVGAPSSSGGSGGDSGPDLLIIGAAVGGAALILAAAAGYWFGCREESRLDCCSCDCYSGGGAARPKNTHPSAERRNDSLGAVSPRGHAPVVSSAKNVNVVQTNPDSPTFPDGGKLPSGWQQHFTEQGAVYFHNAQTGESTWTKPIELN